MLFGDGQWWGMDRLMLMRVIVAVLVALVFALGMRSPKIVPGRFQGVLESGLDFVRVSIAEEILGKENGRKFLPIIATIFFATLFLALVLAVCAAIVYAAVSIEPSVPVAGPDDPINAERKR